MRKKNPARNPVKAICLCAALVCASTLFWGWLKTRRAGEEVERSRLAYEEFIPTPTAAPSAAPTKIPARPASSTPAPTPTPKAKAIQPEFEKLRAKYGNDDIVGYLKIDGTSIDYPITHSADNAYYLHYDINKKESDAGWVFMDYENNIENDDHNIVIYGHNMRQDIMFHSLRYYQSWGYFNEHRRIVFNTVYDNYVWEVFSFYRAETSFPYIQVLFPGEGDFDALAAEMKARSIYDTGVEVKPGDHILTLSTCTNEDENTRFVLNARRLNPEEAPAPSMG